MKSIVFIGAGSMAEAVIAGIVTRGAIVPENVYVTNKSDCERLIFLQEKYGISILDEEKNGLRQADLVLFATRPNDVEQAMADVRPYLKKEAAVLSVIAGVSIDTFQEGLGERPIARSMPNTSATLGKSATGIAFNEAVDAAMQTNILSLLEGIGLVQVVPEDDLHVVTALSGSGPAYVYYLAEALEEAAIQRGLSKEVARSLIVQTLEGAAAMMKKTGEEPAELRKHVTSPGGTTAAGIRALEQHNFKEVIADCLTSADIRSREIGSAKKIEIK